MLLHHALCFAGDFVIAAFEPPVELEVAVRSSAVPAATEAGASQFIVRAVLYKDQIRHLKTAGMWPFADDVTKSALHAYDPYAGIDDSASAGDSDEEAAAAAADSSDGVA